MKCFLLSIFCCASLLSLSQSVVPIRGDLIRIYKSGGAAELQIENATRNRTGGFLKNIGSGLTEFAYAFDSAYVVGDSIRFRRGDGYIAIKAGSTSTPYTAGYGLNLTGTAFSADSLVMTTWARLQHVRDSLVALMPAKGKVTNVAVTGTSIKTITITNADGSAVSGTFSDNNNTYSTEDNAISISGTTIATRKGFQTFTDGPTVTINCSQGYNWKGTIGGNRTLAFSNAQDGDIITVIIKQDNTGGRTMTWPAGTVWINPSPPTLKTGGGLADRVTFQYDSGTWWASY